MKSFLKKSDICAKSILKIMKNYLVELIGTFFLVLVIGLSGNPLAIGSILMVMVYMGGHISGAHYNPAVTLAVWMRKKIDTKDALMYMVFQVLGAVLAAFLYYFVFFEAFAPPAPMEGFSYNLKPLIIEAVFTFALCSVVLNVATTKKTDGNSYYGLAIGFTICAAAYAGGPVSGGAFNPAVGIGPILLDTINGGNSIGHLWLYIVGPLLGGAVAAVVFKIVNPEEFESSVND